MEHARWESGHGGYTGTIAEKDEFTVIQTTPLRIEGAEALADRLILAGDWRVEDKWGPAGALPVVSGSRAVRLKGVEYQPRKGPDEWEMGRDVALEEVVLAELRRKRLIRRGETVLGVMLSS